MTDTQQGPGWWLASDGRWYPPPVPGVPPLTTEQVAVRRTNRRLVLVAVGVILALLIVGAVVSAVRGPSAASRQNKAVEESCFGQLQDRVARARALGVQLTQHEQTVFYDYCVDVGEGRVPTERPAPIP